MKIETTWTRLLFRNRRDSREYYRHPEHGGLTEDPLLADLNSGKPSSSLLTSLQLAKRAYPQIEWELCELVITVKDVGSAKTVWDLVDDEIKKVALAKLTEDEKRVLGLEAS